MKTMGDWVDLGLGHSMKLVTVNDNIIGGVLRHPVLGTYADEAEYPMCEDGLVQWELSGSTMRPIFTRESSGGRPLSLSPFIVCAVCGDKGWIVGGVWHAKTDDEGVGTQPDMPVVEQSRMEEDRLVIAVRRDLGDKVPAEEADADRRLIDVTGRGGDVILDGAAAIATAEEQERMRAGFEEDESEGEWAAAPTDEPGPFDTLPSTDPNDPNYDSEYAALIEEEDRIERQAKEMASEAHHGAPPSGSIPPTGSGRFIDVPTDEWPEGSVCPVHKRVHNSHGWYVCVPDEIPDGAHEHRPEKMAARVPMTHEMEEEIREGMARRGRLAQAASPDAVMHTNEHGGRQSDLGVRFDLIDGKALAEMAAVLDHGAKKYGEDNWRAISVPEHLNHALVHAYAYISGDESDEHLSHFLTRAMFALAVEIQGGADPEYGTG